MKRIHFRTILLSGSGILVPLLVLAAGFQGPPQSPPNGNVPGVIWNEFGTGLTQPSADINIAGKSTVGSFEISQTPQINFFNNLKLDNGKAFRVDQNGATTFNMGNWGGAGGSSKPLTFTMYGDQKAVAINGSGLPGTAGNYTADGTMKATQFCFNPGNPSDCITAWPTGGGAGTVTQVNSGTGLTGGPITGSGALSLDTAYTDLFYVNSWGDTMNGPLDISASGSVPALNTVANSTGGIGIRTMANGINGIGGWFTGSDPGMLAQTAVAGVGTAVRGNNGSIGGEFQGSSYGVRGLGGSSGGLFTNTSAAYTTYVAYNGYGVYASVPTTSDFGLYTNGKVNIGGELTLASNLRIGTTNVWGDGLGTNNGNKTDPSGAIHNPYTVAPVSNAQCYFRSTSQTTGNWIYCPNGTYMAGFQANIVAQTYNIMCCYL
jgi:hypothetical protein